MAVKKALSCLQAEQPLRVRGDKMKIRRIAQNLLMNSIKYTEQGSVEIRWEQAPENHWVLIVKDTGPGLEAPLTLQYFPKRVNLQDMPKTKIIQIKRKRIIRTS